MAETLKILAQAASSALTNVTVYTVTTTAAVISTMFLCNTNSASGDTVRVYAMKSTDGAPAIKNALYYDLPMYNNDTFAATCGITLATGDSIVIYSNSSLVSCQLFGSEIT